MNKYGFIRVASAVPCVALANPVENLNRIETLVEKADDKGCDIVLFPELSLSGYTCADLFLNSNLLKASLEALHRLIDFTANLRTTVIVGLPLKLGGNLYDASAVIHGGELLGISVKNFIDRDMCRWFSGASSLKEETVILFDSLPVPIGANPLFSITSADAPGVRFAIEIGTDAAAVENPGAKAALGGASIIFNPCANVQSAGFYERLVSAVECTSAKYICGYVNAGAGYGESTTDKLYAGTAMIADMGRVISQGKRFTMEDQLIFNDIDCSYIAHHRLVSPSFKCSSLNMQQADSIFVENDQEDEDDKLVRSLNRHPFIPSQYNMEKRCEEIFNTQVMGLVRRMDHTHCKSVAIGISGGLDSTLALLVAAQAFKVLHLDSKGIHTVTMPGFGTTGRTYNNAVKLIESLGCTFREISVKDAVIQHFNDIGHDIENHNVVYENSQARERTQILMDIANQINGMVVGTGDMSELALGWATYNGDHMSMYNPNCSISKTLVQTLVRWRAAGMKDEDAECAAILLDIVDTPISPELTPASEDGQIKQKTEDLVGPYELHDFFLYHLVHNGASVEKIRYLAYQAFIVQAQEMDDEYPLYDEATIDKWLATFTRRFFAQQYKRSCSADGIAVGSVALSPRGGLVMPSDVDSTIWR